VSFVIVIGRVSHFKVDIAGRPPGATLIGASLDGNIKWLTSFYFSLRSFSSDLRPRCVLPRPWRFSHLIFQWSGPIGNIVGSLSRPSQPARCAARNNPWAMNSVENHQLG
jgi:hypothetical protein